MMMGDVRVGEVGMDLESDSSETKDSEGPQLIKVGADRR